MQGIFILKYLGKFEQRLMFMSVMDMKIEASPISALILRAIFHAGCHSLPCMSDSVFT